MPILETYGKLGKNDTFDLMFWQGQSPIIIFEAAYDLIRDYFLLREGYAGEPRLQRTVESF